MPPGDPLLAPSEAIRTTLVAFSLLLLTVGGYYRAQSEKSGERLDRTKEGWPILIGIRLLGLLTVVSTTAWLWNPSLFFWASLPIGAGLRWIGVTLFATSVAWLLWVFSTLGRNLTDTVVTRRDSYFVDSGPYRFIRNPMYSGIFVMGMSLGAALGTWLIPSATMAMFTLWAIRTRIEERYLVDRFDDRYRDYMRQVGRFFPKILSDRD